MDLGDDPDGDMAGYDGAWRLNEEQTRAKAIELLDMCNSNRLDAWIFSGISAGVLDADLVEKVLNEELHRRSPDVQHYWKGPCTECVHVSPN